MNKFDKKVDREANRRQKAMFDEIEAKYPDETVIRTIPSPVSEIYDEVVFGPNLDAYINDIGNVPSIYRLKKEIRKELKRKTRG